MNALPKHLRPRWRYLAVGLEAWPTASLDRRTVQSAFWEGIRHLLGDVGGARAAVRLLRFEYADGRGQAVVRVRRDQVEQARAGLACIDRIDDQPVGLHVRGVSGTVRACEEKYIRERRESSSERPVAFADATRMAVVRDDRLDVRTDDGFAGATELDFG